MRPISDPTPGKRGTAVTLPHTWNASYVKDTYYNRETMVYHRTLTISETMLRNNRLFLRFEGANSVADVFVNRKHEVTDVKVYSNQKDATLYVNGNIIAKQQSDDINRIVFKGVHLSKGKNTIRVKAGKLSDECIWRFEPAEEK